MDSMYEGYSISAQGAPGTGGPTGQPGNAGKSGSVEDRGDEGTSHLVQDESAQPNAENEEVVSPGVVIVREDEKDPTTNVH